MTWRTHAVIGANAIWLTTAFGVTDSSILILLPAAAFAGLLPDIDASGAKIHYLPGPGRILGIFKGGSNNAYFHHRGIMHSLLATVLLFIVVLIFSYQSLPLLAPIVALSFLSHIIIDGFNTGVGYFFPFILKHYPLLPRQLLTKVKGPVDNLLFVFGALGLVLFLYLFTRQYLPTAF